MQILSMRHKQGKNGAAMKRKNEKKRVLMLASVASMIDQFNMPNICLLLEMGYEVHTICNFKEGNTCDDRQIVRLQKKLIQMRVRMHQWDCPRSVYDAGKCYMAYLQLCRLLEHEKFLWIHCHSPVGSVLARMAAHKRRIPIVYTAHGFHFYQGAPLRNWLLYYPVEKALSCWTDVLITVNQEDYRLARNQLQARKIFRIPGVGIDMEKFVGRCRQSDRSSFCRKYHIPQNAVLLLSVGELSKRKNHGVAIRAVAMLQRTDVYYVICGQGPLEQKLMQLALKCSVADKIRLVGFEQDTAMFYQNADIFVFPSLQEGMPAALMEAMAAGLPCIVSDIRGNRELIPASGATVFHPKKPDDLKRALEQMLADRQKWKEYQTCNRNKICAYSQFVVQKKMAVIYEQMEEVCIQSMTGKGGSNEKNR